MKRTSGPVDENACADQLSEQRQLRAHQIADPHALPIALDEKILAGREPDDAVREPFDEALRIGADHLARDGLNHRQHVLRAVIDLAHQQHDLLLGLVPGPRGLDQRRSHRIGLADHRRLESDRFAFAQRLGGLRRLLDWLRDHASDRERAGQPGKHERRDHRHIAEQNLSHRCVDDLDWNGDVDRPSGEP